jgi:hypothetical protein
MPLNVSELGLNIIQFISNLYVGGSPIVVAAQHLCLMLKLLDIQCHLLAKPETTSDFHDVPLACEQHKQIEAHKVIISSKRRSVN